MRKEVVVGIVSILILTSVPIAVGGEDYCNVISKKDRLDLIFDDIFVKMDSANSQEECNLIFKEAVIELDKYGLLGDTDLEEVIKLVSGNDGSSYSISGKSSHTSFLGKLGVIFYELSEGAFYNKFILGILSEVLWLLFYFMKDFGIFSFHTGSWVTFGSRSTDWEGGNEEWTPSEGWIKIVEPSGEIETEYNSKFYGYLDSIGDFGMNANKIWEHLVGVKGFRGINIGDYYLGTAEQVDIRTYHPI
jgi:hypothetical protein